MAILALAVIPALLLDDGSSPTVHVIATSTNWIVWLAFCAEFVALLLLAPRRRQFVLQSWFDLLIGPLWSSDTPVRSDTRPASTRLGITWRHVDAKSTAYR